MRLSELGDILEPNRYACHKELEYWSECPGRMVLRTNNTTKELFWGCSNYPNCRNSYPFILMNGPVLGQVVRRVAKPPSLPRTRRLQRSRVR